MKHLRVFAVLALALVPSSMTAQVLRLGSDNRRTIEINATGKVSVTADSAVVKLGFANQAESKDAAYADNVRAGNKIVRALLDAGVSKEDIQTESVNVGQEDESRNGGGVGGKRLYSARQQWQIRVAAADAQKTIDISIAAGSNTVEGVEWDVVDPQALQEKAYAAALTRAKEIAEGVAAQAGVKLGEVMTIINGEGSQGFAKLMVAKAMPPPPPPPPPNENLRLYAGKIEREETVTVIYGIKE
jgi:uncharacterized protein YggE